MAPLTGAEWIGQPQHEELQRGIRPQLPADDPFYDPPVGFQHSRPGTVLRSRGVELAFLGLIPQRITATQLLYRTTDMHGNPEAAASTVGSTICVKAVGVAAEEPSVSISFSVASVTPNSRARAARAPGTGSDKPASHRATVERSRCSAYAKDSWLCPAARRAAANRVRFVAIRTSLRAVCTPESSGGPLMPPQRGTDATTTLSSRASPRCSVDRWLPRRSYGGTDT